MMFRPSLAWMRARAYKQLFLTDRGDPHRSATAVLADLKRFCHVERPTAKFSPVSGKIDPIAMAMAEGRREVWMRIQTHLNLTEGQLASLIEQNPESDQ